MATLRLSRSAQPKLGQRHHQRTRRLIQESKQPEDWEIPDELPPVRGMMIEQCHKGMLVQELISPHRRGKIIGFGKGFPYKKLPLVEWESWGCWGSSQSVIHPAVIVERTEPPEFQQLSLF